MLAVTGRGLSFIEYARVRNPVRIHSDIGASVLSARRNIYPDLGVWMLSGSIWENRALVEYAGLGLFGTQKEVMMQSPRRCL